MKGDEGGCVRGDLVARRKRGDETEYVRGIWRGRCERVDGWKKGWIKGKM